MGKKVTIQDIADALNLSRNTVSKAINNSGGLAESTKIMILEKAVEMGYKQFSYVKAVAREQNQMIAGITEHTGEIALFTPAYHSRDSHFSSLLLDKFQKEAIQFGFTLVTYVLLNDNLKSLTLPPNFRKNKSCAIVCIEVFDKAYADMVCGLGLPVLFIDGPCYKHGRSVNSDLLMMGNFTEIQQFIHEKAAQGLTRFGFIGDHTHCLSFYERYAAFRMAVNEEGLKYESKFVLLPADRNLVQMREMLCGLDEYPDCFICVNDFNAIDAMMILKSIDPDLLKKVRFLGYDDSHESRIFTPPLSTVHIHTQSIAFAAIQLLMTRMQYPSMEYRTVHVATDLILRESTEF